MSTPESEGLQREMGYIPRDDEGPYYMDGKDAFHAMLTRVMNTPLGEDWATPSEKRALQEIMDDEIPRDFIRVKREIDEED